MQLVQDLVKRGDVISLRRPRFVHVLAGQLSVNKVLLVYDARTNELRNW